MSGSALHANMDTQCPKLSLLFICLQCIALRPVDKCKSNYCKSMSSHELPILKSHLAIAIYTVEMYHSLSVVGLYMIVVTYYTFISKDTLGGMQKHTFLLYLVVAETARTSFLILLVAR
jgi:hypothetical protein